MTRSLARSWATLLLVVVFSVAVVIMTNALIDGPALRDPSVTFSIVSTTPPARSAP